MINKGIKYKFDQSIKLFLVTGQVTAGPSLAPILGQYDIKPANEFISKLNDTLKNFESEIPVSITVRRDSKSKNLKIIINGPTLMCFIDNFSKYAKRSGVEFLSVLDLFNIVRLRYLLWKIVRPELTISMQSIAISIISTIGSSKIKIFDFKGKKWKKKSKK